MFVPTCFFSSEILDALRDFDTESEEEVLKKIKRDIVSCYDTLRTNEIFCESAIALGVKRKVLKYKKEELEKKLDLTYTGYFNTTRGFLHEVVELMKFF